MLKDTKQRAKSARSKTDLFDNQPVEVKNSSDFTPTSAGVAAFYAATKPGTMRKREPLPAGATAKPRKQRKKADSDQQASAAGQSRYYRNKSGLPGHPLTRLESNRQQNREVADLLAGRATGYDDNFYRISRKIRNCSVNGAFRELSPTVANKVGQAMCKHRGCPTCQRILGVKRRAAVDAFFAANEEQLLKYNFYHLVLTVRHSAADDVRNYFYFPDLISYFKRLRGVDGGKAGTQRKWWDKRVAGGFYSVETTPSKDKTAHIHLHILLVAKMPLWRRGQDSVFLKTVKSKWLAMTGEVDVKAASSQVHLEPVFTWERDAEGEYLLDAKGQRQKDYPQLGGATLEHLRAAVSECAKYTMKTDAASLGTFSDAMLSDLLTQRHRYYGRFGVLHAKHPESSMWQKLDRLNADFCDLEEMDAKNAKQLWNPETQQEVAKHDTKLSITPFRNTIAKQAAGSIHKDKDGKARGHENYFQILDRTRTTAFESEFHMPKALSLTIYRNYDAADDLLPPGQEEGQQPLAPDKWNGHARGYNYFRKTEEPKEVHN